MIDRTFELQAGDIIKMGGCMLVFVQSHTTWGGLALASTTQHTIFEDRVMLGRDWIRYLDGIWGCNGWELYRNIGDLQFWPLPRPQEV